MSTPKNPIKHVQFSTTDYFKPSVNPGGSSTPLKPVTKEFRNELLSSIDRVYQSLEAGVETSGVDTCAALVELESNATAKSHRPKALFNEKTCPFFGDQGYGKLLIQVNPKGLEALRKKIETAESKKAIKALSTIKSIRNYSPKLDYIGEDLTPIIIRLFRYNDDEINLAIDHNFENLLDRNDAKWVKHLSESVRLYKVFSYSKTLLDILPSVSSVQSAIRSQSITVKPMTDSTVRAERAELSDPEDDKAYPIIGVVDSGVSANCPAIQNWIAGSKCYIPEALRDFSHGTFVSGLLSNAFHYNQDIRFPSCQSKVFSVEVLGNGIGDVFEIINAMYEVAEEQPEIKIWNLSLGSSSPVSLDEISTMALMLDEFQDKYDCLCVVAAGNYTDSLREWPPVSQLNDGVSSPADSVRAITVGALAHVDGHVRNEEPSPFSRRGPVSNYIQKPDLVHFGGNILSLGGMAIPLGVNSVCPLGNKRNDVGTSFSTPVIATIAANIYQQLGERASPNLVKALLIHNANMNHGHTLDREYKHYFGWGLPRDIESILEVNDYETTLAFQGHAQKSFEVEKLPFPIPSCLRTEEGKVRAEFFITLVYQPNLDPNRAFEYCQFDVNVGFGEYKDGSFSSKIPRQQEAHNYESELVKNGDKWSPIKVYQKRFPNGINIEHWKLRVSILDREGIEVEGVQIPFTILLTIRDIDKEKPVYNEMAQLMDAYNWEVSDLLIEPRIEV
ncbi:S8 family peptidase [Marinobacterium mangrovicola]|uniref:Subtilase family protein n=1 Tax=Marinobacterium mangrovicola TaxID=1476959 RepID=A0A4R1GP64_9GAMM|nr:S8 family peptidase [Marinobacterium mangrovicola]TCK09080.1 subtilase family protein [Marinobacterium mangrovicola]